MQTIGFPFAREGDFFVADGTIRSVVTIAGLQRIKLDTSDILEGLSGAPILDLLQKAVVGVVTGNLAPVDGRLRDVSLGIPVQQLQSSCPSIKITNVNPYRNLSAYEEQDYSFFFGRTACISDLVSLIAKAPRLVAILGPSGSGKSSLIRAGLAHELLSNPAFFARRWGVIVVTPGSDPRSPLSLHGLGVYKQPLDNAARSWLESHPQVKQLLLVIDQFEELFVRVQPEVRERFIDDLISLAEARAVAVSCLIVLRDDFYPALSVHTRLIREVERGLTYNVPSSLSTVELEEIIQGPAQSLGVRFPIALVQRLVSDATQAAPVEGATGARSTVLPMLQSTLWGMWNQRVGAVIPSDAYPAGGLTGALSAWANSVFGELPDRLKSIARRLLLLLVDVDPSAEAYRVVSKPLTLSTVHSIDQGALSAVVYALANGHLIIASRDAAGESTIELVHESLIVNWDQLAAWVREDAAFLAWRRRTQFRCSD